MTNVDENVGTNCVQTTDQFATSDVVSDTGAKDLDSVGQQVTMSAVQLQDILASVKQVFRLKSASRQNCKQQL